VEKKLECVRKRDGRTVPFDRQKIADAIFKAAQSVGGQDRYLADDLAEVVRMYLIREYKGDVPSVEEIQDVVERILIKTGHARTAKAYILYRQKRARARKIREGFSPEDLSEREQERARSGREVNLPVRRSDDNVSLWDKNRIVAALVRETGLSENVGELIVMEVEEEIIASKVRKLSSVLIRELVNAKLIQYGFEEERSRHARLGLPFYDVKTFFESFGGSPDELSMEFGRAVKREFAMNSVLPDAAVEKHLRGELIIRNREGIDRCYCAVVPVLAAPSGEIVDEIRRLLKVLEPFTEKDLVLSLPENVPLHAIEKAEFSFSRPFMMESPLSSVKEELILNAATGKIPASFRIDSRKEMERYAAVSGNLSAGGTVTVSPCRPGGGIFVLNRISVNLAMAGVYAEQSEMPLKDYIRTFIPLCSETMKRQFSFLSGSRAGSEFLKVFGKAEITVEAEFRDAFREGTDFVTDEGFISELLGNSLSFVTGIPAETASRDRLFQWMYAILEQSRAKGRGITVRIASV